MRIAMVRTICRQSLKKARKSVLRYIYEKTTCTSQDQSNDNNTSYIHCNIKMGHVMNLILQGIAAYKKNNESTKRTISFVSFFFTAIELLS